MVALACAAPLVHAQSDTCQQGYVWREACPGDHVCVTPETRAQVAADNAAAASRRVSANSDRCVEGYVWRGAQPEDHVCVTPETRKQTEEDNRLAASRLAASPQAARLVANLPPGFHVAGHPLDEGRSGELPPPLPVPPLASGDILKQLQGRGMVAKAVVPDTTAKILDYTTSSWTVASNCQGVSYVDLPISEVQTLFFAASCEQGYVSVSLMGLSSNQPYLLDCPLRQDGAYSIYITVPRGTSPPIEGTVSSYNRHLLIPLQLVPENEDIELVSIRFSGGSFGFYACRVDRVVQ
jgi:hypothetical protein